MKKLFVNKKFYLENINLFFKWIKNLFLRDKNLKKKNLIKINKNIIKNNLKSIKQKNLLIKTPYYSRNEFENIISSLPLGYDTKLEDLVNIGFLLRNNRRFLEALEQ
jgi:hypothetical protein